MLGALGLYGASTCLAAAELRREFGAATVEMAACVFFFGSLALTAAIAAWEIAIPGEDISGLRIWRQRFAVGASTHAVVALAAGAISLAVFVVARPDIALTWSEARAEDGVSVVAATFLLMIAFPGTVSAMLARRWLTAAAILLVCAVAFLYSGSRAAALGAVAMFGWFAWCRRRSRGTKAWMLGVLGLGAFAVHTALRILRGIGVLGTYTALQQGTLLELFRSSTASTDVSGGESAIGKYFVFAVHSTSEATYGFLTTAERILLLYVPSWAAPFEKPMDVTYRLWAAGYQEGLFAGAEGAQILQDSFISGSYGSVHATLFGELYLSGGWTSLLVSCVVVGGACVIIDRMLLRIGTLAGLLLIGPTLVGQIMISRGNSVIGVGYFAYLALPLVVARAFGVFARRIRRNEALRSVSAP